MMTRPFRLFALAALFGSSALAANNGPSAHARGGFDAATGVYTVVSGDALGAIAARFGMSLAQIDQQNALSSNQIQVGQKLVVAPPSLDLSSSGSPAGDNPMGESTPESTPAAAAASRDLPPDPCPRKVQALGRTLLVYQPQVESWKQNQLTLRSAVAIKSTDDGGDAFGVILAEARTQVDREQRMVVLQDLSITKADFPTVPELANTLATNVDKAFGSQLRIIPLDRLEASLGIAKADAGGAVAVQNPVPRVIVSQRPAILVPIQGTPVLKPAADSDTPSDTPIQRIINTRAVILTTGDNQPYYLHLLDGWVTAPTLAGPWVHADITPAGIDAIASQLAARGAAGLLNGNPSTPTVDLLAAGIPDVYVSQTPTELMVFQGQPDLVPVDGTALLRAKNTSADVFVDTDDNSYYAFTAARGDDSNWRTGTSGRYAAGRSYNPYTGVAQRGYGRTFDTAGGVQGAVARGERYNPATGVRSSGSRMAASGAAGGYVSRDTERARGPLGGTAAAHQTTVSNPRTGETRTLDTARVGNSLYAGADGSVYRNTGDGWQRHDDGGWQDAGDTAWADREQQARSVGDDRLNSGFGSDDRFGGGDLGEDLGGRFGDGGLAGNRLDGGGFADRFGSGGFGGRFHGRR